MLHVISWILIIEILGIIIFPITSLLFSNLADKGYSISKPFGILILGLISWFCSSFYIVSINQISLSIFLLIISLPSIYIFYINKTKFISFFKNHKNMIILTEIVWISIFLLWLIYRSFDPSINHTEQPMDHGLLTSSIKTTIGSPKDMWLSSYNVNYYYFGYWMMGIIAKISQTPPQIAYNLSLALIPSLASAAVFGLLSNISQNLPNRKLNLSIIGLTSFTLINISSNLEPVLELFNSLKLLPGKFVSWVDISGLTVKNPDSLASFIPNDHWWWWRASRVINSKDHNGITDYTIQEFPSFSFLLGDLHPHVMALPFVLIFVSFCWNLLISQEIPHQNLDSEKPLSKKYFPLIPNSINGNWGNQIIILKNVHVQKFITILFVSILLGSLTFLNIWDFPTLLALLTVSLSLYIYKNNKFSFKIFFGQIIPFISICLVISLMVFYPYFGNLSSSVNGLKVVEITSRPIHILIVWGLLITPIIPFVFISFYQTKINSYWKKFSIISFLIASSPYFMLLAVASNSIVEINIASHIFKTLPIAIIIGICIYTSLWETKFVGISGKVFVLMITSVSLGLILGAELLYLDDLFSSSHERMNTLFKLYYQAGILSIIASSFSLIYGIQFLKTVKGVKKKIGVFLLSIYLIIFSSSLYYTPATISSKIDFSNTTQTLDGLEYLKKKSSEYEIIEYLLKNSKPTDVLLESVGEWENAGLISRSTGVSNVFNWPGHEIQWRGNNQEFEIRSSDINLIFTTLDNSLTKAKMMKYHINYVYIGPRESQIYSKSNTDKFQTFMKLVVDSKDSKLYYWEY